MLRKLFVVTLSRASMSSRPLWGEPDAPAMAPVPPSSSSAANMKNAAPTETSWKPVISHDMTDPESSPQAVVVHLLCATRLPRLVQLNRSSISPFATMTVIDHTGKEVGERAVWAPRYGTKEPVWNCAHDMKLPKMPYQDLKRSLLHVELWDHDGLLPPNPIAQVSCGDASAAAAGLCCSHTSAPHTPPLLSHLRGSHTSTAHTPPLTTVARAPPLVHRLTCRC